MQIVRDTGDAGRRPGGVLGLPMLCPGPHASAQDQGVVVELDGDRLCVELAVTQDRGLNRGLRP